MSWIDARFVRISNRFVVWKVLLAASSSLEIPEESHYGLLKKEFFGKENHVHRCITFWVKLGSKRCRKNRPRLSRHDSLQSGQLCSGGAVNAESVSLFTSQTKWIRGPTKKLGSKLIPFSKSWLYGYSWLMLSQSIIILLYYCIKAGYLEFGRALCQDNDSKFGTLVAMKKPRLLELLGSFFFRVKHVGKHKHRSMIDHRLPQGFVGCAGMAFGLQKSNATRISSVFIWLLWQPLCTCLYFVFCVQT